MRRRALLAALALAAAAPLAADGDRVAATRLPTCADGEPFLVYIVDASADDDCDATGGGTTEAPCLCLDGAYVAMLAAGAAGASVALDLGDDGSNESSALTELAITGDDYSALTEPSADKALLAFAKIPPYRQYDPDRPPVSCATCDEWTGDAAALTWRWANQDSATSAIAYDGETITGDATNELHVRFTTAPSNTDQTATARIGYATDGSTATADACGLIVLHGGTEGSPSNVTYLLMGDFATDGIYLQSDADYAPAAGATSHASIGWSLSTTQAQQLFYQLRYTDSTRALLAHYSWDGKTWTALGTAVTLAADPISWGYYARQGALCRAEWFRIRTDAGRDNASD